MTFRDIRRRKVIVVELDGGQETGTPTARNI